MAESLAIILDDNTVFAHQEVVAIGDLLMKASRMESDIVYACGPIQKLARMCHGISRQRGRYSNPATGEAIERNTGEVIALMHSEVSEAWDAFLFHPREADKKCPAHSLFSVEIADTMIRIADTIGAKKIDAMSTLQVVRGTYPALYRGAESQDPTSFMMMIHGELSAALEADRKHNDCRLGVHLFQAMFLLAHLAWRVKIEIGEVLFAKCIYNLGRADHNIENRSKTGGKAY